jgi:hypothetical protein
MNPSLDQLQARRRALVTDPAGRVRYLNTLRAIVGRRCEVNKVGVALVSDYDLLDAEPAEIVEALDQDATKPGT